MSQPAKSSSGRSPVSTRHMVGALALSFYSSVLRALNDDGVPFVVGGAFAMRHYAGIARDTKDLDVFLRRKDLGRALEVLRAVGARTELTFPHWLVKAWSGDLFVDVIYNSANGLCPVDDGWFATAPSARVFGIPVKLCPVEEVLWTKCFVMERERFDGADVIHLVGAQGPSIDWTRLLERFGKQWRVLYGHLVFFAFALPGERGRVPTWVLDELEDRIRHGRSAEDAAVCRGTLLSREQYLVDLREQGYEDARVPPWGSVAPSDIAIWTDAIGVIK